MYLKKLIKRSLFRDLCWFFDHAETVTDTNLERIKALNGGIAIQHRMAFQGEYFIQKYGEKRSKKSPAYSKNAKKWAFL